jgi:1-acyl-sn-glycerol-3-phosphate acyltransferase
VPHFEIPPSIPRTRRGLLQPIANRLFRALGWRFEGEIPNEPKLVAIVAPHTSNWDFPIGLVAKWALRLKASWLGKHTLFRPPFGWIMRRLGGIAVDRQSAHNVVDQMVHVFRARERLVLVIAPEGTRKKVQDWKTGFLHIARGAGVPILLIAFDWRRRVIRLGPTVKARSDVDVQLREIREMYDGVTGKHPANA